MLIFKALFTALLLSTPSALAFEFDCGDMIAFFQPHNTPSLKQELNRLFEAAVLERNPRENDRRFEVFAYSGAAGVELAIDNFNRLNPNAVYDDQTVFYARLITESAIQTLNHPAGLEIWMDVRGTPVSLSSLRKKLTPFIGLLLKDHTTDCFGRILLLLLDWEDKRREVLADLDHLIEIYDDTVCVSPTAKQILLRELIQSPHKVKLLGYFHKNLIAETDPDVWASDVEVTSYLLKLVMQDPALKAELVSSKIGEEIAYTGLDIRRRPFFSDEDEKQNSLEFPSLESYRENLLQLKKALKGQ